MARLLHIDAGTDIEKNTAKALEIRHSSPRARRHHQIHYLCFNTKKRKKMMEKGNKFSGFGWSGNQQLIVLVLEMDRNSRQSKQNSNSN